MEEKDREKKLAFQRAVGERVYRFRTEAGMSRETLAERLGITPQYVNEIERGKKCMSMAIFAEVGQAFRVSLDELAHGVQPPEPDLDRLVRHLRELSPLDRELVIHMLSLTFRAVQELGPEE